MEIIITADDLGISKEANLGIKKALEFGTLTDTCLLANGEAFDDAINQMKEISFTGIGIHLNIVEGKALTQNGKSQITDNNGVFNLSYTDLIVASMNKKTLSIIEKEFRAQIEKILSSEIKPQWINSHVHIHSIPRIFELVCKLAKEYNIPNIRTQAEIPYKFSSPHKNLISNYSYNILKNIILNTFTLINKKTCKKYSLNTNEKFVGVLHTGFINKEAFINGLNKISDKTGLVECILHPTTDKENKLYNYEEFLSLLDEDLKKFINDKRN